MVFMMLGGILGMATFLLCWTFRDDLDLAWILPCIVAGVLVGLGLDVIVIVTQVDWCGDLARAARDAGDWAQATYWRAAGVEECHTYAEAVGGGR